MPPIHKGLEGLRTQQQQKTCTSRRPQPASRVNRAEGSRKAEGVGRIHEGTPRQILGTRQTLTPIETRGSLWLGRAGGKKKIKIKKSHLELETLQTPGESRQQN